MSDQALSEYYAHELRERDLLGFGIDPGETMSVWRVWQRERPEETPERLLATLEHLVFHATSPAGQSLNRNKLGWVLKHARENGYRPPHPDFRSAFDRRQAELEAKRIEAEKRDAERAEAERIEAERLLMEHYPDWLDALEPERRETILAAKKPGTPDNVALRMAFVAERLPPKPVPARAPAPRLRLVGEA